MSSTSKAFEQAYLKVRAQAWSQVATVAVCDGMTVLSHHPDFSDANIELCRLLDGYFEASPSAGSHNFKLVALRTRPTVGSFYNHADVVHFP